MPEWLESELAHHLAPVQAPPALTFREPAPQTPRWSFTLAPILAMAAAIAVVILATAPSRIGVAEANRYLRARAGIELAIPADTRARIEQVRMLHPKIAAVKYRIGETESTVLIAGAGASGGADWKQHGAYSIAGGCTLCHASL